MDFLQSLSHKNLLIPSSSIGDEIDICKTCVKRITCNSYSLWPLNVRQGVNRYYVGGKSREITQSNDCSCIDNRLFLPFNLRQRWKRMQKSLKKSGKKDLSKSLSTEWIPYSCERDVRKWQVTLQMLPDDTWKVWQSLFWCCLKDRWNVRKVPVNVLLLLCSFGRWLSTTLEIFNFLDNQSECFLIFTAL